MDVFVVSQTSIYNTDTHNDVNIFKTNESALEFIEEIYKKYEKSSKDIYDEYIKNKSIECVSEFNYPDMEDLIDELLNDKVNEKEIIKTITMREFVRINKEKVKIDLNSNQICNFTID